MTGAETLILKSEIDTDSLFRGYSGMNDQALADDINTVYRTLPVSTVTSAEIYEAIDWENLTLTSAEETKVDRILGLGSGIRVDDSQARRDLVGIFKPTGTNPSADTITALVALQARPVSRAEELGLGLVKPGHVETARGI